MRSLQLTLFLSLLKAAPVWSRDQSQPVSRLAEAAWSLVAGSGTLNCTAFTSQSGQDIFSSVMLRGMNGGFYLDIGAYDGISQSNSHFLEQQMGWNGLCVEGGRNNSRLLRKLGRRCQVVEAVIAHMDGDCLFEEFFSLGQVVNAPSRYTHPADCRSVSSLIKEYSVPRTIDFVSLDIEGAEMLALEGFPFHTHRMRLLAVEHNAASNGGQHQLKLFEKLSKEGYVRLVKDHGIGFHPSSVRSLNPHDGKDGGGSYEDWYAHRDELPAVSVTVSGVMPVLHCTGRSFLITLDDKPLWTAFRALSTHCKGDSGMPCWEGCWEAWDEGWGSGELEGAAPDAGNVESGIAKWRERLVAEAGLA